MRACDQMWTTWVLLAALGLVSASASAQVEGVEQAGGDDFHDCVVVVLDASGSMEEGMGSGQTKMEAAKLALKKVLARIPEKTWVGILVFSASNLVEDWVRRLAPRGTEREIVAAIDPIQPGGGTPLGRFIKKGADRLLEEREKQFGYGSYRLLIVTDGEASDDDLVMTYTPDVLSRGITMDVIGVKMAREHTLATKAHSYRRADDPESLTRAVNEVFAEVTAAASASAAPGEGAFDLTDGLDPEVALQIIGALASSGNHPVGEQPLAPELAATEPVGQPDAGDTTATAPPAEDSEFGFGSRVTAVVAIVALLWIIRKAKKASRRARS